jgi:hypothetical protein
MSMVTTTSPQVTTTPPVDAVSVVTNSIAASGANYRFSSVVSLGEETITNINGIVDAGSVSAEIVTGGRSVSYIRTPAGEWVTNPDGAWVPLEGEPAPATPPLAALSDSTDLRLETGDTNSGVFSGRLGPAAGPAQGLPFSLTIQGGLVSQISYLVEVQAGQASVTTTLADIGSAGAVAPPPGV